MTMTIEFSPQAEAWFNTQARQTGLQPAQVVKQFIDDRLPIPAIPSNGTAKHVTESVDSDRPTLDAESLAAIALLESWRKADYTEDSDEIKKADGEWEELQRNLNANRAELGDRLVYV